MFFDNISYGSKSQETVSLIKKQVSEYNYSAKGVESFEGKPVMLHMWI